MRTLDVDAADPVSPGPQHHAHLADQTDLAVKPADSNGDLSDGELHAVSPHPTFSRLMVTLFTCQRAVVRSAPQVTDSRGAP